MSFLFKDKCFYKNKNFYIDENKGIDIIYKNSKLLTSKISKFQKIEVYDNNFFGKLLVIDDDIQLTEHDERNYHEMLVHVPLNYLCNAKKVLIIGGGDGGTLREVCEHKNVNEIIMIEIDIEVIKTCKKYFPELSKTYNDKRLDLKIVNGANWVDNNLKKYKNYFDVILVDSTDYNTAMELFTEKFYINLGEMLKEYGILSFNCMSISWEKPYIGDVLYDMKKIFKYVNLYQAFIPTYASGHYSFCFCSNKIDPINTPLNCQKIREKNIKYDYYNNEIHTSSFNLPNEFKKKTNNERLGTSVMIDIKNSNFNYLNNLEYLTKMLLMITEMYKLTPIAITHKIFQPQGISINILLEESHLSIHTWPEKKKCSIDMFTCSKFKWNFKGKNKINKNEYDKIGVISILKSFLKITEDDIKVRGFEREI